jgi:hypothetical protein
MLEDARKCSTDTKFYEALRCIELEFDVPNTVSTNNSTEEINSLIVNFKKAFSILTQDQLAECLRAIRELKARAKEQGDQWTITNVAISDVLPITAAYAVQRWWRSELSATKCAELVARSTAKNIAGIAVGVSLGALCVGGKFSLISYFTSLFSNTLFL